MSRTFSPVIHVRDEAQALANARIAYESDADGCFLISHGDMSAFDLMVLANKVIDAYPGWAVGVNYLDLGVRKAMWQAPLHSPLWTDDLELDDIQEVSRQRDKSGWKGALFGSVAFKYKPQPDDLRGATELAKRHVDVVVTSGPRTGVPPDIEKIRTMRSALGDDGLLGVASGLSAENVEPFLPYVDCFLVATSIGLDFHNLDPRRCREMARKVHGDEVPFSWRTLEFRSKDGATPIGVVAWQRHADRLGRCMIKTVDLPGRYAASVRIFFGHAMAAKEFLFEDAFWEHRSKLAVHQIGLTDIRSGSAASMVEWGSENVRAMQESLPKYLCET